MDLIKVYGSGLDIKPRVLLKHFLRYMGFYVEEILDECSSDDIESLVDIYIISKEYIEKKSVIQIKHYEKVILICMERDFGIQQDYHTILYTEKMSDKIFLSELISPLARILEKQRIFEKRLIFSVKNIKNVMQSIAEIYTEHNILPSVLYNRCFYEQEQLYRIAKKTYINFIDDLEKYIIKEKENDLLKYIKTYAMFEWNSICKKNSYKYPFEIEELLISCLELHYKYPNNEEIQLLQADIYFELDDFWAKAANIYASASLNHCAYAHYKHGRILRKYAKDYESAINILNIAIQQKKDYYAAWYQLATCYEELGRYKETIKALEEIYYILKPKYQNHLLEPIELEYLYKTMIRLGLINKVRLEDYIVAAEYEKMAKKLVEEADSTKYLKIVWSSALEIKGLAEIISSEIKRRMCLHEIEGYNDKLI